MVLDATFLSPLETQITSPVLITSDLWTSVTLLKDWWTESIAELEYYK